MLCMQAAAFRAFTVIDDFNREAVAIETDTSLTARRLIRVFERLRVTRGLLDILRVDNGLSSSVASWSPGPNQSCDDSIRTAWGTESECVY